MEIIIDKEEKGLYTNQKIKVCLIGIDNAGKTSFLDRINSRDSFKFYKESIKRKIPTVGASYISILVKYKGKLFKLYLWELAGQLKYFALTNIFCQEAHIILNFYNPFKKESFEYIKNSFQSVKESNRKYLCKYIIIKNKYD